MTNIKQNYRLLLTAFTLFIIVILTFRKTSENSFVDWDDFTYVMNNDLVKGEGNTDFKGIFTRPVSSNYHPLTILTMRMNNNKCATCPEGISPAPFIKTNIFLHICNTLLVLFLIYLLSNGNLIASFIAAALFGVHPMHVESVAWISERKDVLYSFFFLSGLVTYVLFKKSSKYLWLGLTFLLFLLSCLSKATGVVFPVVLILVNYWFDKDEIRSFREFFRSFFSPGTAFILLPFFIVSVFFGLMAYRIQDGRNMLGLLEISKAAPDVVGSAGPFTLWQKIQTATYGFSNYIFKFFFPFHLSAFYPYPGTPEFDGKSIAMLRSVAPVFFILIIAVVLFSMKKTRLFAFGIAFYLVTIALVLQFIPVGYAMIADRYSYLPYIGLSFIVATLVSGSIKYRKLLLTIAAVFIIIFIVLSGRQVRVWNNTETLWSGVAEKYPAVEIARRSRGKFYSRAAMKARDISDRRMYEEKALADFGQAIKSGSRNPEVYEGAGVIYGSRGDNENALKFLDFAVKADPRNGSIYYNRAITLGKLNRYEEAIRDYNMALIYAPEKAVQIMFNRSDLFLATGKLRQAIGDLDFLISNDGRNATLYYNRAVAKQKLNDIAGAIFDYQKVLMLDPSDRVSRAQMEDLINRKK